MYPTIPHPHLFLLLLLKYSQFTVLWQSLLCGKVTQLHIYMCCCAVHSCRVLLFATLWSVACQAPLSLEFPRQEHWSGLPFPPQGDLPDPGIASPALSGRFFTIKSPGKPVIHSFFFFFHIFPYGLSQAIGYSSLCYTVGPCCLSILSVIVCVYQPQTPRPSLSLPPSTLVTTYLILVCLTLSLKTFP